jgi:hypothetical protein
MKTILSLVFVRSHARKSMRMQLSRILSFFRTRKGYTKNELMEYPLSSFHAP